MSGCPADMSFDLTDAPVMNWEEYCWMLDRAEKFRGRCAAVVKADRQRGNLEMRFEETAHGPVARVARGAPAAGGGER